MDLKDFIAGSLIEIAQGVNQAINEADNRDLRLRVNPMFADKDDDWDTYRRDVEFDVAVTVSDTTSVEGKGGIRIWVVEAGLDGSQTTQATTVSHIKFSIPVLFPAHRTFARK